MTLYQLLLAFMSSFSFLSLKLGWVSDTLFGWGKKNVAKWHCLTFEVMLKKFSHFLPGFPGTLALGRASHHLKTPAPQKLFWGNPKWLYQGWYGEREWAPSNPSTSYLQGEAAAMWLKKPLWTFDPIGSAGDSSPYQCRTVAVWEILH